MISTGKGATPFHLSECFHARDRLHTRQIDIKIATFAYIQFIYHTHVSTPSRAKLHPLSYEIYNYIH